MAQTIEEVLRQRSPGRIATSSAAWRRSAALPPEDGIAAFNRLYLEVTRGVLGSLQPGRFQDGRFLRWLDVVFANLYFEALRALSSGRAGAARVGAARRGAREAGHRCPLQFALAGMNAHINRDLPVALVDTCRSLRIELRRPGPQYDDFCRVNDLLEEAQGGSRASSPGRDAARSTRRSAARTTCSRCGTCERPARQPGRTARCCGRCAASRTFNAVPARARPDRRLRRPRAAPAPF